jgi:hypothetical protein
VDLFGYGMVWYGYGYRMLLYGYGCGMLLDQDDFGITFGSCVIYSHHLCGSHFMVIKINGSFRLQL